MHALNKGQVCDGGGLKNALPGHASKVVGMKEKGGRAVPLKYRRNAMVKIKILLELNYWYVTANVEKLDGCCPQLCFH